MYIWKSEIYPSPCHSAICLSIVKGHDRALIITLRFENFNFSVTVLPAARVSTRISTASLFNQSSYRMQSYSVTTPVHT
jgi:hypothetical protein